MARAPIKPIRWGEREAALLAAVRERADALGVELTSDAAAIREAMAVAAEAPAAAWERARRRAR